MTEPIISVTQSPETPRSRASLLTTWLYVRAIAHQFRYTLALTVVVVALGTTLHLLDRADAPGGKPLSFGVAMYATWMSMLAQPMFNPPSVWYLGVTNALFPVMGVFLIGEGVVRLALLVVSKQHGEKEWMRVMASTYRDHIVLCGVGRLGYRVLEHMVRGGLPVVAIEKNGAGRFVAQAKALGAPVLIRDMKEDQALIDAGIQHASAVCICTNDGLANVEVALDAKRMNPNIRVVLRLFDQQFAQKISGLMSVDAAFSASALAAPMVIAMTLGTKVLSTVVIGDKPFVMAEVPVAAGSALAGKRVDEIERGYSARLLAIVRAGNQVQSAPSGADTVSASEMLIVHVADSQLASIASAGRAG